jgi:hypothetical protein
MENPPMNNNPTIRLTRATAIGFVFVAMAGCSTQHTTYTADGRRGYMISCDGYLNSYSSCLVKAGRACGGQGYDIIRGGEDERSMLVACKLPK